MFTNGSHRAFADTTEDKGGHSSGFRPHELLEAALGTCVNMHLRMYADTHHIPLEGIRTSVDLDRRSPHQVCFRYSIEFHGPLSDEQRLRLNQVAKTCPVRKTLSKEISFQEVNQADQTE